MTRILGRAFTVKQRAQVLSEARSYLGVPWRHQGRTRRGIDCLGLIALAFGSVRPVVDREGYGRTPYNGALRASLIEHFGEPVASMPVAFADLRPCDVVTMKWTGEENHVAIVTDHPDGLGLIHAYSIAPGGGSGGRVIEHRMDEKWLGLISEAFRP